MSQESFMKKHKQFSEKHNTILKKMGDNRVFRLQFQSDGPIIEDGCDNWYGYMLDKKSCIELSDMFKDLADFCK